MTKQEFLDQLETIVSRALFEKDYIDYIEDTVALVDNYTFELQETN